MVEIKTIKTLWLLEILDFYKWLKYLLSKEESLWKSY